MTSFLLQTSIMLTEFQGILPQPSVCYTDLHVFKNALTLRYEVGALGFLNKALLQPSKLKLCG